MEVQDADIIREVTRGKIKHVLFDFDGTISLLRKGWQEIMHPMMIEAICGDETLTHRMNNRVSEFIDETTGVQTIVQMHGLVDLVREFGFVSEQNILSAQGYREIYNKALMVPVNARIVKLDDGSVTPDEMCVAGARSFVEAVASQGVSLYIFSGTNQEDVRNEAGKLQVAHHFTEIWGALKTMKEYSKEKILTGMIEQHRLTGPEMLIIGDGPVEIRLAHEHGCISVGVASNEKEGGHDPVKHARLLDAGADITVPDFTNGQALVKYLFDA